MRIKRRSVVDTIYSAITPALVRFHWRGSVQRLILLLALLCSAKEEGFAKCGNVDYSWGADALASAHDYAVTMMLYVVFGQNHTHISYLQIKLKVFINHL